jgi:hypothetical protein
MRFEFMPNQCIGSSIEEPSEPFTGCTCLVLERGYEPALELLADVGKFDGLESLVLLRFTGCEIVITIREPNGVLNSVGCDRRDVIGAIRYAIETFGITDSRWGVLCTPPVALVAMALFNGMYDFLFEDAA